MFIVVILILIELLVLIFIVVKKVNRVIDKDGGIVNKDNSRIIKLLL